MKRRIIPLILALLFLLAACQSQSDEAWNAATGSSTAPSSDPASEESSAAGEPEPESQNLTVSMGLYADFDSVVLMAKEFEAEHEGTKITFDYDMDISERMSMSDEDYGQRRDSYLAATQVKLMSGEAADILYDISGLNHYSLSRSGVYADLGEFWTRDMDDGEFFMPVMDACMVDGKRSIIPFGFALPVVYVNSRITDALEIDLSGRSAVSTTEMIEWYHSAREQGVLAEDSPMFFGFDSDYRTVPLYQLECTRYIDVEGREAALDSPESVSYLDSLLTLPGDVDDSQFQQAMNVPLSDELIRQKATGEPTNVQNDPDLGLGGLYQDYVTQGKEALFYYGYLYDITARDAIQNPCEYMAGPFAATNSQDQSAVLPMLELVVTSSCKNPELAWEFIKYCISGRETLELSMQNRYIFNNFLSVNRANAALQVRDSKGFWSGNSEYNHLSWYWAEDPDPEEAFAAIDRFLDRGVLNYKLYTNGNVAEILRKYLEQGLTDSAQCASELQDQAYIWLNE